MRSLNAVHILMLIVVMLGGIFILDVVAPSGVAVWVLYSMPLVFAYGLARPQVIVLTTLLITVLIVVAFFLSIAAVPAIALLNRCLGLGLIWFMAAVFVRQRQFAFTTSTFEGGTTGSNGDASSVARDDTKHSERELARMTRLYAALSQINQAIVWTLSRDELMQKVCQILVEHGGFRIAWIGWYQPETHELLPVAVAGDELGFLRTFKVHADDRPEARGPTGLAFRSGRECICNGTLDGHTLSWQAELERCGFNAAAAWPIRLNHEVCATLTVYSDQPLFFQDMEIGLLKQAATDISFALDNFDRDAARRQAEQTLRNEKHFRDTMIESVPGIVYFYDTDGQFLSWNRNFETVSGYSGEEINRMNPRDFFSIEEQPRIERRIAEVFANGQSSVEASFVTKDGRTIPYFFTGRRVLFEDKMCLVGIGIDISDRQRVENQLAESERKYRELVELSNCAILRWSSSGRIMFLNEFGQRFFGYSAEEIVGYHLLETIVPPIESSGRDLRHLMDEIAAAPEAFEQNINENVCRDGRRVWVSWTNRIVRDPSGAVVEILSVGTDITERKRAETRVAESEARYRTLFEYAPDGIVISNHEGIFVDANPSICRMLDYSRKELIGLHSSNIVDNDEIPQIAPALSTIRNHSDHHGEWKLKSKHDSVIPAEVIATMMPDGNILGMIRDITERREAEADRVKRYQAEAADRIKSAFLATMSHELRTPLNSIIGFTGIMLQGLAGPLNHEQNKQLDMVSKSARHLLALVNDVLDISKIEAGQVEVACELFDLKRSINKVLTIVKPLAEKKLLSLHSEISPELDEALSDERRFEQILLNLLSNAVKFTDRGEIKLVADLVEEFQFPGSTSRQNVVRVRVFDTGIGIKLDDVATLFQPFRQIDTGLSRKHDGTGLGLAICRRLADLMGGTIAVDTKWQQGSVFTVTLPLKGGPRQ